MENENLKLLFNDLKGETLHIEVGKFYHQQGNFEKAIEELRRAIEINPSNELAHFEMGNVYVKVKDDPNAEAEYKKVLDLNPHFFDAALELGRFYHYRQRRIDLAVESFNKAIQESPLNWGANYELGKIYKQQGYLEKALVNFKIASESNPGFDPIHFELGKIYRDLGMPRSAIKEFERILRIGDNKNDVFIKNKVLNEIEITQRKIILESKVRAMVAMITSICNAQCIMCNIWKSPWQASQKTMDEIVGLFPYVEDMVWEGGEVFLMKGFENILEQAASFKHLKQVIFTNGLFISDKIIEKLIRSRVDIVFSIDAATKQTYEAIRRKGSFEQLLNNLAMVKKAKEDSGGRIETHFNAVIMKSNYHEIEKIIDFAKEYNFNAVTLTPIRGRFAEENIFENNDKQALENIRGVIPKIVKKAYEYGIILNMWLPGMQSEACVCGKNNYSPENSKVANKSREEKNEKIICYAPWQRLVIDIEGMVRPFVFCLKKWIGDTAKNSLDEIWNSQAMRDYRTRLIRHDYKDLCEPECISGQVAEKIRDIL